MLPEQILKLPNNFLQKLNRLYPDKEKFEAVAGTFLKRKTQSFRINFLKTNLINLRFALDKAHIRYEELDFPKGAFLLKGDLRTLQNTNLYNEGHIYVQNVSSQLPVVVLDPQNNDRVLDLCAAPGGKTTQIVSLAPQAEVHAIEKNRVRFYKLMNTVTNQGAGNQVKLHLIDGIWVRKKFPEAFDKILVDAPCSTEGLFFVDNHDTFKYWKDVKVREMTFTQKKLLHSVFFALDVGGEMVYSTCTISPEENEGMVDYFLDKFKGKIELMPIKLPIENVENGLKRWDKRYSEDMIMTKRVLPNDYLEAFFVAKFKKIGA
jgi:16S rRNA C967 or C1407 C5-methylase (RsmB/RsmF family)